MPNYDLECNTQRDLERFRRADDDYKLRHLATHLHEAGQYDKLYRLLVGNKAWMNVKSERLDGHSAFVEDLELAISDFRDPLTATETSTLVQLWTARQIVNAAISQYTDIDLKTLVHLCCKSEALSHVRLRSSATSMAEGLLAIHDALRERNLPDVALLNEVLAMAEGITDPGTRTVTLLRIAVAMAEAGQNTASAVFDRALVAARSVELDDWGGSVVALSDIGTWMARVNDTRWYAVIKEALALTRSLPGKVGANARREISRSLANAGYIHEALEIAHDLSYDLLGQQEQLMHYLVTTLAERRCFDDALDGAHTAPPLQRARLLGVIARSMAIAGDSREHTTFNEAVRVTRSIELDWKRLQALGSLAAAMTYVDHKQASDLWDEARHLAYSIQESRMGAELLADLAANMASVGNEQATAVFTAALDRARAVQDQMRRRETLATVAAHLLRIGWVEDAHAVAQGIGDSYERTELLREIVKELVKRFAKVDAARTAHYLFEVFKTARQTTPDSLGKRDSLLRETAAALSRIDKRRAPDVFNEALDLIRTNPDSKEEEPALASLSAYLVNLQHLDGALTIAYQTSNKRGCAELALRYIAQRIAGMKGEMVTLEGMAIGSDVTYMSANARKRAWLLCCLAIAKAKQGHVRRALRATQCIPDLRTRARVLRHIAAALAHTGRFDSAFQIVDAIEGVCADRERAQALSDISSAYIHAGCIAKALDTASVIDDEHIRLWSLASIAEAYARSGDADRAFEVWSRIYYSQSVHAQGFRLES